MTPVALAFDPSPDGFAFAVVALREGMRPHALAAYERRATGEFKVVQGPSIRRAREVFHTLLSDYHPTIIAVEGVAGYLSQKRVERQRSTSFDLSTLVDTAIWAGMLIGFAPNPDKVFTLPANGSGHQTSWRFLLTGNRKADDAAVAGSLNAYLHGGLDVLARRTVKVKGAPGVTAPQTVYRDNNHKRDAMGLAVTAILATG